ncbi:MAG: ATP-binding protein [Desulfobacterales bacterium]|nr:ATP-binding protein [Desulfobacterales bacterium]
MTDQTIEMSIPSHPRFLQLIRAVMGKVSAILEIPRDQAGRITLAVDEACSNIIKYAYLNAPSGKLDFLIHLETNRLEITITDYGKACDINKMKPRDISDIKPGGLGTYIISQVMDTVEYQCGHNGRNRIRMVAALDTPKEEQSLSKP